MSREDSFRPEHLDIMCSPNSDESQKRAILRSLFGHEQHHTAVLAIKCCMPPSRVDLSVYLPMILCAAVGNQPKGDHTDIREGGSYETLLRTIIDRCQEDSRKLQRDFLNEIAFTGCGRTCQWIKPLDLAFEIAHRRNKSNRARTVGMKVFEILLKLTSDDTSSTHRFEICGSSYSILEMAIDEYDPAATGKTAIELILDYYTKHLDFNRLRAEKEGYTKETIFHLLTNRPEAFNSLSGARIVRRIIDAALEARRSIGADQSRPGGSESRGTDLNQKDHRQCTPLYYAYRGNKNFLIKELFRVRKEAGLDFFNPSILTKAFEKKPEGSFNRVIELLFSNPDKDLFCPKRVNVPETKILMESLQSRYFSTEKTEPIESTAPTPEELAVFAKIQGMFLLNGYLPTQTGIMVSEAFSPPIKRFENSEDGEASSCFDEYDTLVHDAAFYFTTLTPLHYSVLLNLSEAIKSILLLQTATIDVVNSRWGPRQETPLQVAFREERDDIIRILLMSGKAHICARDVFGDTLVYSQDYENIPSELSGAVLIALEERDKMFRAIRTALRTERPSG